MIRDGCVYRGMQDVALKRKKELQDVIKPLIAEKIYEEEEIFNI